MEEIIKRNSNIILTFFIMITIIISTIFNLMYKNLRKESLIEKFEETNIYKQIYEEIQSGFENYVYQSGLEPEVLKNICDETRVRGDFLNIIDSLYENVEIDIDTYSIKISLDNEINKYVENKGIKLNNDEKENIEKFEDLIADTYGRNISSYISFKDTLNTSLNDIVYRFKVLRNVFFIISVVLIICLLKTDKDNIYIKISFIGVSLLSAGIILLKAKNIINANIDINNLIVLTKALSNIIIYLSTDMLDDINQIGKIYILAGWFIIVMTAILGLDADTRIRIRKRELDKEIE